MRIHKNLPQSKESRKAKYQAGVYFFKLKTSTPRNAFDQFYFDRALNRREDSAGDWTSFRKELGDNAEWTKQENREPKAVHGQTTDAIKQNY